MATVTKTARDILILAMKQAGVLGVGQTPLAEDISDCYEYLVMMMGSWQAERWLVPALMDILTIGNNAISNTIGPGGYWNVPRPEQIKGGYVIQLNTGSTPVSLPLIPIFSYEDYIRITVKALNTLPDHFFYDGAFPLGNVFIWPVPSPQYECHLLVETQFNFPSAAQNPPVNGTGLDTVFILPQKYYMAIHYNLAIMIASGYTLPVDEITMRLAKKSLNVVRTSGTQVPRMVMPAGLVKGKAFNIFNADGY